MQIMVGRIKLSAPKISRQISPHPSPISTLGRFFDSIHCSTMITTNKAVIAKSMPVVSIGSTEPSSAPIAEPAISKAGLTVRSQIRTVLRPHPLALSLQKIRNMSHLSGKRSYTDVFFPSLQNALTTTVHKKYAGYLT